ncbi:MAG: DUF2007 domain-containing protein [Acidimicrobiia bacterium]|nr:DUF2007 domain-containing protein [Acidimicrobiia bacterium]
MNDRFEVVARFDGPGAWSDAETIRLRLESAGIPAVVAGDRHAPFSLFLPGLVRVEVRATDADDARSLVGD